MSEDLSPHDVRNRTKAEAKWIIFKAEMLYLVARGWTILCGIPEKYYVPPGLDYLIT